ncbi:MAG TPA: HEAT repeat domain-containing protein [Ktedonobacteraceae bacterium]|jgi:HEAT repeat protein
MEEGTMEEQGKRLGGPDDPRTIEELFRDALVETDNDFSTDEDIAYTAISALQFRGGHDIFEHACKLCASENVHERRVGVDILAQLGVKRWPEPYEYEFPDETIALLLSMLEQEQEPQVLHAIAVALGHRQDPRAIAPLARFKNHPHDFVRFGVVFGLMGNEDDLAVQTLIELSTDIDADVRDWATFALGCQIETDTPAIRAALVARLTDEDDDASGEAMVGLARRHDSRVVEPLLTKLEDGWFGSLLTEAAAEIGDPRLYPVLVQIREKWDGDEEDWRLQELDEAIEKCQPS